MDFKKAGVWAVTIFLAFVFVMSGSNKLMDSATWTDRFVNQWGLPAWMAGLTGLTELVAAVLILIPKRAVIGGSILATVMLGATGTHLMAGEYPNMGVTLVLGTLAAFIAYYRRPTASR